MANVRTPLSNANLYYPFDSFGPWGRWYPYYDGYGWGYTSYNAFRYGSSRYGINRYGYGYDPYDPFCFGMSYGFCDPGMYGGSNWSTSATEDPEPELGETGSIRLKASPATAKVYVDGSLVGVVGDFDGLKNHLQVAGGVHQLEIKADGYAPYAAEISVTPGKTMTHRASLKKQ